jgi:hypothetical protein
VDIRSGRIPLLVIAGACALALIVGVKGFSHASYCTANETGVIDGRFVVLLLAGIAATGAGAALLVTREPGVERWRFVAAGVGFCVLVFGAVAFFLVGMQASFACGGF